MSEQRYTKLGEYIYNQIRARRTEEGRRWSWRELARRTGVSSGNLSMIARGEVNPDISTLERIASVLDVPVAELLGVTVPVDAQNRPVDDLAMYIARRLTDLPSDLKIVAVDMLAEVVDSFHEIADERGGLSRQVSQLNERIARLEAALTIVGIESEILKDPEYATKLRERKEQIVRKAQEERGR